MMHVKTNEKSGMVIGIVDAKTGRAFKELSPTKLPNGRSCSVRLPFDSEYSFLINNMNSSRALVHIEIDGINVTENGLVINAFQETKIERFVGTAKKFKFVPLSDDDVQNPYNNQNGIINISVELEASPELVFNAQPISRKFNDCWWQSDNTGALYHPYPITVCYEPGMPTSSAISHVSNGATVEGGYSTQTFGLTKWGGTKSRYEFNFYLTGYSNQNNLDHKEKLLSRVEKLQEEINSIHRDLLLIK